MWTSVSPSVAVEQVRSLQRQLDQAHATARQGWLWN